ncbi:Methicillin resistance regulatory protein MecI [Rubripirellula lacrimiformis]|uniref:Methicillin resistance regulatory protein MecI n=1 Tax=Rubripirellula lacrimiformis TaxID=1930273 RepID=A0A517ND15_9BACT|nr:BlaI/MecI/CopY family transcriptional regulator [Rubripirellula lacrimiformis]QDT04996.1 Methicillin resistance regulatory protein MecI [Rubripirellula lacrimiformis]
MARHASSQPTEVELQILRILWDDGPSIVRNIHDSLQQFKQTTYSTTVKMLSVMLEKGLLKRDDDAKPQVYRPAAPQQRTQKRMLGDLIDKVYDGSSAALMMHALSSKKATAEELQQIRDLLDQMVGKS